MKARTYRVCLLSFALLACQLAVWPVLGQEAGGSDLTTITPAGASEHERPTAGVTAAELTAKRSSYASDGDIDEATRLAIEQHLVKAAENLQAADQFTTQLNALKQELDVSAQRIAEMQQQLVSPVAASGTTASAPEKLTLDAAQASLKERDDVLQAAKSRSQQIAAEMERRAKRRPQLSDLRLQAVKGLEDTTAAIAASSPDGEHAAVTETRMIRLKTRRARYEREIELIDQEGRTYEGTTRYWTLQRDLADRAVREAEKAFQLWQQRVTDAQKEQAAKDALAARQAAARAHPAVKSEAARNAELAQENSTIVSQLEVTQNSLKQVETELATRQDAFSNLKRRAITSQFSQAIGVLLRNQQAALPSADELLLRSKQRQKVITQLNLRLMELDVERRALVDLDVAINVAKQRIQDERSVDRHVEDGIRETLASRLTLLGDLIENGNSYLDRLVRLDSQERELMRAITEEASWLAEHVLWVRSADVIGGNSGKYGQSLRLFLNADGWRGVGRVLALDMQQSPWWLIAGATAGAGILLFRRPIKSRIQADGVRAQRASCVRFFDTVEASLLTLLLAGTIPGIVWLTGWRISSVGLVDPFVESVGLALQVTAACWFLVESIRSVSQVDGIGEDHFDWPHSALGTVRKSTQLLLLGLLPTVFMVALVEYLGDEHAIVSLGRTAYLTAMGLLTVTMFRIFRPSGKVFQALESHSGETLLFRFRWVLSLLLIAGPATLAAMSAIGYHYTAIQLTGRLLTSLSVGFAVIFLNGLASRWLLIAYRRMAMRRAKEKRQQLQSQHESVSDQPAVVESPPELKLADINSQAARVLRLVLSVAAASALYLTWVDVMPALSVLQKIHLWENHLAIANDANAVEWVTAADVTLAIILAATTLFAARNLPGLLEMTVLQRLPLDAGARYAATTVSRYVIFVVGALLCFHEIGIGWSNVQWLIAAMTVGLGFGLQEIFANFVSGIILLFERPIRLGDTVTIGDIHGTVSRIRIRATTIVDWDNKELIVPNKEFVTGHLVNWTLTNPTLRLIVNVGVAYGSDTRLTTNLLYRVAHENSEVLSEPEPVVVFKEFGDSALNFELRVFVNGLTTFRRLKHELHLAIDDLFREHEIEIAFPQRDLHLRSLPAQLLELVDPAQLRRDAEGASVAHTKAA